jgi:hypothetical protein
LKRKINKRQIWLGKKTVIIIITVSKKLIEPASTPLIQQMMEYESHPDFHEVLPSLHFPLVPVNE